MFMSSIYILCVIFSFTVTNLWANPYKQLNYDFLKTDSTETDSKSSNKKLNREVSTSKKYSEIIKDCEKIDGLFTFFWNQDKNEAYISFKPNQLETIYQAGLTRQSGDAYYFDGSSMMGEYPFIFKKIGNKIQFLEKNVWFRADEDAAVSKSIANNLSNSLIGSSEILSKPHPKTGAILVDADDLFLIDFAHVSSRFGGRFSFDKKNSYYSDIKSFPHNSEIEVTLHFKSKKSSNAFTLPSTRSMMHRYHLSLSEIPETDYTPRLADDRVGYFLTMYQDYTNMMRENPYVRYINRWDLEKAEPRLDISPPKKHLVYWLENTIPVEYRNAIREGVLAWNKAFEAIGIKDAIIVKQMPDDADWDPADVRYNTIRWIVQPGFGYAVGPSRANPFTGELYDADIRVSADFVRAFYNEYEEFVTPVTATDISKIAWDEHETHDSEHCNYANNLREQMGLGWSHLISNNIVQGTKTDLQDYVHKGLVDLLIHEVGHTLGLRHNFKASSIYSVEQLSDPEFTAEHGISGSAMDYHPVCLLDNGNTMFQTEPGPYDMWAIEYGYSQPLSNSNMGENEFLESIAKRSTEPLLTYGTDEDTYGLSSRGIDPLSNTWDMSNDPIAYYENQLQLVEILWNNLLSDFETEGTRYHKIRSVFSQGIGEYNRASSTASKYIGGVYMSRHHVGDPNAPMPLIPVPADGQRRAMQFIGDNILAKNAFDFSPELLNKLAPERFDDFKGSVWGVDRIDYPIHRVINYLQRVALYRIMNPRRIGRVHDNEIRFNEDDEVFEMSEIFDFLNSTVWSELDKNENINSYRRELQRNYVELMTQVLTDAEDSFPKDALSLTRSSLMSVFKQIKEAVKKDNVFDAQTIAHLKDSSRKIYNLLKAQMILN